MDELIDRALSKAGDYDKIEDVKLIAGGSINESYYVKTVNQEYFVKCHRAAPAHFFDQEAQSLERIRETNSIHVPEVFAYQDSEEGASLVMEWVDGEPHQDTQWKLGDRIAAMHQAFHDKHGLSVDSFIGTLPQSNGLFSSWLAYYRDKRLYDQLQIGIERGMITGKRRNRMEKLLEHLHKWVPDDVMPSYLHGDLWAGNWLCGKGGEPYVIDPSFLYGDRHFELAFTEVFGGFSKDFYQAYEERFPISSDYEDIKPLYQLYYLLAHLNMFGEIYGRPVDKILQHYTG